MSSGTKNYRAPEIKNGTCKDPQAADIYSMGIILFMLVVGVPPYMEGVPIMNFDFYMLLITNPMLFWDSFEEAYGDVVKFTKDFKDLFEGMVKGDP